jgi:hypothetical protein
MYLTEKLANIIKGVNMNLRKIINELGLTPLTTENDFETIVPETAYTSDLLSCVMSGASRKSVWVTLQAHNNIVAIASLLELSAVIITENARPEPSTLQKAQEEGVILLGTHLSTYEISGRLWELGLRAAKKE